MYTFACIIITFVNCEHAVFLSHGRFYVYAGLDRPYDSLLSSFTLCMNTFLTKILTVHMYTFICIDTVSVLHVSYTLAYPHKCFTFV